MDRRRIEKIFPYLLLAGVLLGCSDEDSRPPIIFSIKAEPKIVEPGGSLTVTVEAGDPDKDKLSYTWSVPNGRIEGSGKSVIWYSPEVEGKYDITVKVSDGSDSVNKSVTVRVWKTRPGDYYPLSIGNRWIYKDESNNIIISDIIDTIDVMGTKVFVKQTITSGYEGAVNFSYVAKSEKGVDQYALGGASAGDDTIIFSPALPLYRFPLIPGETWDIEFEVKLSDGFFVGNGKTVSEVISEEDLTVPAGSFSNVFQVKEDFSWELLGQKLDHTISRQWLAPNVGVIKFINEQTRGNETFITEAILQSYSLK